MAKGADKGSSKQIEFIRNAPKKIFATDNSDLTFALPYNNICKLSVLVNTSRISSKTIKGTLSFPQTIYGYQVIRDQSRDFFSNVTKAIKR